MKLHQRRRRPSAERVMRGPNETSRIEYTMACWVKPSRSHSRASASVGGGPTWSFLLTIGGAAGAGAGAGRGARARTHPRPWASWARSCRGPTTRATGASAPPLPLLPRPPLSSWPLPAASTWPAPPRGAPAPLSRTGPSIRTRCRWGATCPTRRGPARPRCTWYPTICAPGPRCTWARRAPSPLPRAGTRTGRSTAADPSSCG